jgi:hypothetical protein
MLSPGLRSLLSACAFAVLTGVSAAPARASDLRMTVEKPRFTCESSRASLSRTAYHAAARPGGPALPCCDGQLGCAQFLSTNRVLHSAHRWHS